MLAAAAAGTLNSAVTARYPLDRAQDAGTDTTSAINEVTQAELAVDEAEAAVKGTRLTAPMAGTVVAVNGSLGGISSPEATGAARGPECAARAGPCAHAWNDSSLSQRV